MTRQAGINGGLLLDRATAVPKREIHSTNRLRWGRLPAMAKPVETQRLSWPWWSNWALLGVVATSALTIAATLYDIL
jgi:hypothetical protein